MESLDVLKEICEFKNCIRSSTCSLQHCLETSKALIKETFQFMSLLTI